MVKNKIGIFVIVIIAAGTIWLPNVNLVRAETNTPVFTPQATIPDVWPYQSNNIVNNKALYDIIFRTGSTGIVKNMELTFPTGSNIVKAVLLEESGIGPGSISISGQKLTYTVTSPVSIPSGTTIRAEVGNINNPVVPSNSLTIQVITRDAAGTVIDNGASAAYAIKQIGTQDIADNSVTSSKIQDGQVGTSDLADNSVTTTQLSSKLADNAVTSSKIENGQVGTLDLANGAVTTAKLEPGAVSPYVTSRIGIDHNILPVNVNIASVRVTPVKSRQAVDIESIAPKLL